MDSSQYVERLGFDLKAPGLVLAPHLEYPTRTGANILVDRMARVMSQLLPYMDLVGRTTVRRYEREQVLQEHTYANTQRGRTEAALRTLIKRSHYLQEKFLTKSFCEQARLHLSNPAYGMVLFSYLYTAPLLDQDVSNRRERMYLIETHNDEFEWYRTLGEATKNPLSRLIARLSGRAAGGFMDRYAGRTVLLHVTEADRRGYDAVAPGHASVVCPLGVDITKAPFPSLPPGSPIRLLFVGSLGVTMNFDALSHFSQHFYPLLKQVLVDQLEVEVVGSTPTEAVKQLCKANGWSLHADVGDDELDRRYQSATFSILPFNYATGAKLKLLESLANGVPFLTTTKVDAQIDQLPPLCLVSDKPQAWLERIQTVHATGLSADTRKTLLAAAEPHSWTARARLLIENLQQPFA
jgi:hypothetical protein